MSEVSVAGSSRSGSAYEVVSVVSSTVYSGRRAQRMCTEYLRLENRRAIETPQILRSSNLPFEPIK